MQAVHEAIIIDHVTACTKSFRTHLAKIPYFNSGVLRWTLGYVMHSTVPRHVHHVNLESMHGTLVRRLSRALGVF